MSRAVVDAKEFSHAMSKISKILKKCAIPILEEVCLRIQNGRCTLTATDLETWLTAELPASGDDMFFVFRKTKDILRACSHFAGELTMEFSETQSGSKKVGRVLLRCERRGAEFEVYDGADYPNMPQAPEGDAFSVSSARLSACVERVRYAAEKPSVSARPAAICVQFCGNRVYALDGTRLACDTLEGVSFPKPFLVRADVLAHLSAFGKEDMTVRIGSSHVLFASGNLRMLARLQGVDPYNVDAVIPKGYRESVTVKTADFVRELNYLKECSVLTAKPYVRFAGEQLSIAASGGAFETGIEVRGRGDMVLGFDLYASNDYLDSGFLPGHCLHLSMSATEKCFVLWNPELRSDVIYGDREYPNFPIPRMVFGVRVLENGKVAECSMGVVADEAPTMDNMIGSVPVRLIKKLSASLGDRIAFAISFCPFLSAGKVFHGYEDCSVSLLNP